MDTSNQFAVFGICVGVGFVGGILYEIFAFLRFLLGCPQGKHKIFGAVFDIAFFVAFAVVCVMVAYVLKFPDFRTYTWLGYALGGILYLKTLHQIVAFFENVCYNNIKELIKKAKRREKTLSKREDKNL